MTNSKIRVLIIDSFVLEDCIELSKKCSPNIDLIFGTAREDRYNELKKEFNGKFEVVRFPLKEYYIHNNNDIDREVIETVHKLLNSEATPMFFDRHYQKVRQEFFGPGIDNFYRYITLMVIASFEFFRKVKCDYVLYESTPHQIESWVEAHVAEKLGISILIPHISSIPWRRQLSVGFRKDRKQLKLKPNDRHENELDFLSEWISKVQGNYKEAIPEYEKVRLEKNKGKFVNVTNEFKRFWHRPNYIWNKLRCFEFYQKNAIQDLNSGYVAFFMHYQPERTTLPEGFGFTQQVVAVLALRAALPNNIKIIVKEHPSTFTNVCLPNHRHPSLYRDLLTIPNVELADMNYTSFDLIDNSMAVATVTGSVGIEALLRGKPVVYLGLPLIKNVHGAHSYESMNELKSFFATCPDFKSSEIIDSTISQLKNSIVNSISVKREMPSRRDDQEEGKFRLIEAFITERVQIPDINDSFVPDNSNLKNLSLTANHNLTT